MARSGWKPARFDGRDYPLETAHFTSAALESAGVIQIPHPFEARNQGVVPCCVSCAIAVAMESLDHQTPPARQLSSLYHYWQVRARDNKQDQLIDLTIRDGLQAAVDMGVAEKATHDPAFDRAGALTEPSDEADESARERRLANFDPAIEAPAYFSLSGPSQWIWALRNRMPVVIGFWVTGAYASITPEKPIHGPVPPEASANGHCVTVLGYDGNAAAFRVKDSRGSGWGENGSWWLPYSVADSELIENAFALGKILESN